MSPGDAATVLGNLIDSSHNTPPDRLGTLVAEHARGLGAAETVIYLTTLDQRMLQPLDGDGVARRVPLDIDTTLAGRAFRTDASLESEAGRGRRVWVPLLDGTARLGVLEFVGGARLADQARLRQFAGVVAELIVSRSLYGDLLIRRRRRRSVSLGAELQWTLLPPQTFDDHRIMISAMLEPAHDIAGDSFDYALNGDILHFAIVDAMGHGFEATLLATVAITAYRRARRAQSDLEGTYAAMDKAVADTFDVDRFVTAQVGELNAETGELRWLNAGHPSPLLARQGRMLGALDCEPTLPVGLADGVADISEDNLEPGDHLLFYTDGLVEARSPQGEFFGEARLADLLVRALNSNLPGPEITRRLVHKILDHQEGKLQDDGTAVLINWAGPHA